MDHLKSSKQMNSQLIENILYNKEKKGLRNQNIIRLIVLLIFSPMSVVFSQNDKERIMSSILFITFIIISILFLLLIKKGKNLKLIGILLAIIDIILLCTFSVIWYVTVGGSEVPASFMVKNLITVMSILFIVINSLSLKPLYPFIITIGATLLHIGLFIYAANYPGIEYAGDYLEAFTTAKLSYPIISMKIIILLATGGFISLNNYNTQKTIISAASLERANNQLGRFFSPNVAETITKSDDDFTKIGGKIQDVAVLFSDIRNFTSVSEKLPPNEVLNFLSEYHEIMVSIIFKHHGTLDKFIGDAIMATFGTPETSPDDAQNALKAAIEMNSALSEFNDKRVANNQFTIEHGIGIHYGSCLVGNIGTNERLEYTVIGDTVNSASRIESCCKKLGNNLLFSSSVKEKITDEIDVKKIGSLKVKGKSQKLVVFTVG